MSKEVKVSFSKSDVQLCVSDISDVKELFTKGKNGKYYLDCTLTMFSSLGNFDKNINLIVKQTDEEREAKKKPVYLANGRTFYSDGELGSFTIPKKGSSAPKQADPVDDLPF